MTSTGRLRSLADHATPGPLGWFGHRSGDIYLATPKGGRRFVMTFKRKGMQGAEPMFQVYRERDGEPWEWDGLMTPAADLAVQEVSYRDDIKDIDHPDARLIALAPGMARLLADMADAVALSRGYIPPSEQFGALDINSLLARFREIEERA